MEGHVRYSSTVDWKGLWLRLKFCDLIKRDDYNGTLTFCTYTGVTLFALELPVTLTALLSANQNWDIFSCILLSFLIFLSALQEMIKKSYVNYELCQKNLQTYHGNVKNISDTIDAYQSFGGK